MTDEQSFDGYRVLVTGASGGIGRAIAYFMASRGATVGIHYRRESEELDQFVQSIKKISPQSVCLKAELTNWSESADLVPRFVDAVGGIDGLVNNAGAIWSYGGFQELTESDWEKTYSVNVRSAFETMTSAWDYFIAQGGGRIVNISSASVGYHGSLRSVHYISAKAALESVSNIFAKDGAEHNILVNIVRLGLMNTPMHFNTPGYTQQHLEKRAKIIPVGRMGKPSEAASLVGYLLGPTGSFITGQTIGLTGGD